MVAKRKETTMSSKANNFKDQIWEQFLETGLDDGEWPEYFDEAVGHYNAMMEEPNDR